MTTIVSENELPPSLRNIARKVITDLAGGGDGDTTVSPSGGGRSGEGSQSSRKRKIDAVYKEADERRQDRRDRDDDERRGQGWNAKKARLRGVSYLCYAYSRHSGLWYVGYSGGGGQFSESLSSGEDLNRRNHRVEHYLQGVHQIARHGRSLNNCAEVSALSVALSYNEPADQLIFVSWAPQGHLVNPCPNCQQWIRASCYGYIGADLVLHR